MKLNIVSAYFIAQLNGLSLRSWSCRQYGAMKGFSAGITNSAGTDAYFIDYMFPLLFLAELVILCLERCI